MKRFQIPILALAACGLAMTASPAAAQTARPADAFSKQLFGGSGEHACFARRYDAAHLASHARQNVTSMLLLVSTAAAESGVPESYSVSIGVKFRNRKPQFDVDGFCGRAEAGLGCGVDCDGGKIDVALRDGKSVRVGIPEGARVSRPGDTSEQGERGKTFGTDDKVFRLDRTKLQDCLPVARDAKTRACLRRGG